MQGGDAMRSRDLVAAGISRSQLSRMVAAGELQRVGRGLYARPDYQGGEHSALVAVARRAPAAVFCLLTALRIHRLTTQAPFEVWIAIGNKDHAPRMDYPPRRVMRFSGPSLVEGVESLTVDSTVIRVTSVAKTVADCFKFRNKIGLDVALESLREARRAHRLNIDELWKHAQIDRVSTLIRPYLDAIA